MTRSVLVTGATGQQGGAVARTLLDRGHRVRALTRRPDSESARALDVLGAEPVEGDFDDPESLRQSFKDVDAVFAMGTPFEVDSATEARQGIAVADAARDADVGHVVYSSVASARNDTGIPHFESKAAVERRLAELGVRHTVIAPVAFLENIIAPWSLQGLRQNAYANPIPTDRPLQQIAVADIARFAAMVLEQPERFDGRRVEIASTELTGPEIADVLSRATGRAISYEEVPIEAVRAAGDDDYTRMIEFFRGGGYTVDIPALQAEYPEIGWHDPTQWAATIDWDRLLAD